MGLTRRQNAATTIGYGLFNSAGRFSVKRLATISGWVATTTARIRFRSLNFLADTYFWPAYASLPSRDQLVFANRSSQRPSHCLVTWWSFSTVLLRPCRFHPATGCEFGSVSTARSPPATPCVSGCSIANPKIGPLTTKSSRAGTWVHRGKRKIPEQVLSCSGIAIARP